MTAVGLIPSAHAQESGRDAAWIVRAIEANCAHSEQYTFDAVLELARKNGEQPREVISKVKVKVAIAPEGKYLVSASDQGRLEYLIVSDGRHTWAHMPALNRYMKVEAGGAGLAADPDEAFFMGVEDQDRDAILCSSLVVPILARVGRSAALVEMNKVADLEGEERQLPVLTVLQQRDERGRQSLTEVMVDPETMSLPRLEWTNSVIVGEEQRFAILKVQFENLRIGGPVPLSYFEFYPPSGAQLVEELPMFGLDGAPLFNKPAPDFELQTAAGPKIRLSDLRGRVVLLAFLSNGCIACRQQLAALAGIQEDYKDKGVVILGIATGPKATTGAALRPDAILDDTGAKVHRLYRVLLAPTVVLIDGQGKVVRFLPGARDAETLRAALRRAGLEQSAAQTK
jgi:peroxiredoxin/outer membrane lipoprotein-sorting protein